MKPENILKARWGARGEAARDRGFALVVTLLLMILMTVIAVGLLQLSSVSLRSASHSAAEWTARNNAMMALNLAIAQLQRTAGPDQRITAPAQLADPANPKSWCGVWTPGALAANALTPAVGLVTTGEKNYLVDNRETTPNWKSAWLLEALVSPQDPASTSMVNMGKWTDTEDVTVPEVKVPGQGSIAWWTEDVSQKASLAAGVNGEDVKGSALASAPRVDSSTIKSTNLPIDYFKSAEARQSGVTLQTALLAGGVKKPQNLNYPASAKSFGLFTDPVKGGLRADLTRLVESDAGVMGKLVDLGLAGITTDQSILPGTHHSKTGPRWDRLRSWYRMLGTSGESELEGKGPTKVRQANEAYGGEGWSLDAINSTEPPIHPMVVDAGFHFDFTPVTTDASMIRVHIYPRVTLWNPYNRKLAGQRYVIVMPRHIDTGGGLTVEVAGPPGSSLPAVPPFTIINGWGEQFDATQQASKHYMMFTIEPMTFEAGECLVFTPSTGSTKMSPYNATNPGANVLTANQPVGAQNFYIDKTPNTLDQNLSKLLSEGYSVKRYVSGTTYFYTLYLNWNPKPLFLKAAPSSGTLSATNVLSSRDYPTLQRLYVTDSGAGNNDTGHWSSYVHIKTDWNNTATNNGSAWGTFAANPSRIPPRNWYYRFHLSWIDDADELAAVPTGVSSPQPPYASAIFADWNPMASVVCRTPSTYVNEFFDLHIGCWYRCKAPHDAFGSSSDWGVFSNGKARGCPYGNLLNHSSQTSFPVIDVPDPTQPLQSVGTLRNVPLSPWTWHPLRIVGNSRPSLHSAKSSTALPAIAGLKNPWDSTVIQVQSGVPSQPVFNDIIQTQDYQREILLYDISYETNNSLWDSCFASSWSGKSNWNGTTRLPNSQYVASPIVRGADKIIKASKSSPDTLGLWLSAYLLASEGSFNVNSLSPEAWAAVLGGLKKIERPDAKGNPISGDHPFGKFRTPASSDQEWGGGIGLSDAQIGNLAEKIVAVVKERGPFLGMADFVNRRLAKDESGNRGVLDEALTRAKLANQELANVEVSPNDNDTKVSAANRCDYKNATTKLMDGSAGFIEQGDLLEPLGGNMCARGDTFRIRASGAAYDKDGKLLARMTCEAIVVRSPDYVISGPVESAGSETTGNSALVPPMLPAPTGNQLISNPKLNPINQKFGRRFEVLNLKWLTNNLES